MKLRTVILISIWAVVTGALIVGYLVVNVQMRSHVKTITAQDLHTHRSTLRALNDLELDQLGKTLQLFAETPRLKAVAELADSSTISQLMSEMQNTIRGDFLALADPRGRQLFCLIAGIPSRIPGSFGIGRTTSHPGVVNTDVGSIGTDAYRIASSPVRVGADIVGRLYLGFRITEEQLASLREMIQSDLLLMVEGSPGISTLAREDRDEVGRLIRTAGNASQSDDVNANNPLIQAGGEEFMSVILPLNMKGLGDYPQVDMVVLKPIRKEIRLAVDPVQKSFILLSALVLVVTVVVGYVVSRSVTKPIGELVRGTAEISRGNYDYAMEIPRGVELKFLATKFGEMSQTLKEKIHQLGRKNEELESALRMLREMQGELVRSERLAATGKLTAQLSHEINNPVHNILSSLQTALKKTSPDAPARELLEVAHDEVERLARLTKQLLNVYKNSVTGPDPGIPLAVNEVLREVVASSSEMLRQHRVELDLQLGDPIPSIMGSADKLKQLFLNLIVNARDAMPDGGRLIITTRRFNGSVVIEVIDSGIGIPPEYLGRIFEAFFTTKGKVSGAGIGLNVCYGIVQQHRGRISVKSETGKGATFTVVIPALNSRHGEVQS
ncbi:MAG TPA: ATP-binding protein [Bacteroidota bacterium]|nr:ATP-binding protein [Bacteroidota bacterium]